MVTIKKVIKYVLDPDYRFVVPARKGKYNHLPDEEYLSRRYRASMKKDLNLNDPKTYNEKLQWLKLYNQRPEYTQMVDKHAVKQYVADCIGEEYIIPTLGVWDKFEDIDFDSLPNQFVLKCTHDSGGLVICRDKSRLNVKKARRKINDSLKRDFYMRSREWPYKNVPRKIIAEKYMEDRETAELRDYKFLCFNGEPKALYVATDRQTPGEEVKFDFFDMDYRHIEVKNGHQNAKVLPEKPQRFELMKELAKKLSQGIPHVRIDFYEVDGKVYFGEMTFFHMSGMVPFEPEEWDYTFGSWIELPVEKITDK